jgi:adenylate cyclase
MAKVRVVINGVEGEAEEGQTLLEAAKEIGAGLAHLCLGNAICSTCRVNVLKGAEFLTEKEMKEKVSLNYHLSFSDEVRLGCQARLKGPGPLIVESPIPLKWVSKP